MAGPFSGFERLEAARLAIEKAIAASIKKAAFDVEAHAKANVPVATGFLKSSIYAELHGSSDYGNAGEPPAGAELLPEIPRPADDHTAYVAVGASYGVYVELGTVKMAAQPYLAPALDAVRPSFEAALEKLEAQMVAFGFVPLP